MLLTCTFNLSHGLKRFQKSVVSVKLQSCGKFEISDSGYYPVSHKILSAAAVLIQLRKCVERSGKVFCGFAILRYSCAKTSQFEEDVPLRYEVLDKVRHDNFELLSLLHVKLERDKYVFGLVSDDVQWSIDFVWIRLGAESGEQKTSGGCMTKDAIDGVLSPNTQSSESEVA